MNRAFYILLIVSILVVSCSGDKQNDEIPASQVFENLELPQIQELTKAIEDKPDDATLYFKRSKLYSDLHRNSEALADINTAIQKDNTVHKYYLQLARVYYASGNSTLALNAGLKAEQMNLADPELFILLSKVYRDFGNFNLSDFYLNKAIGVAPFHSDVYLLKARISATNKDTLTAIQNLYQALSKDTRNEEAFKDLIRIYENKKIDSAFYFILEGRKISPEDPFYTAYEGRILERLNLKESAFNAYKTSLSYDSAFMPAYFFIGRLLVKQEKKADALPYLIKYSNSHEANAEALKLTGKLHEETGKPEESILWYEKALAKDTNDKALKINLEKLYKTYPDYKIKKTVTPSVQTDTIKKPAEVAPAPKKIEPVNKNQDTIRRQRREPAPDKDSFPEKPKTDSIK